MSVMNTRNHFGWSVVLLHWLLFILIAGLVATGKYSGSLPRAEKIPFLIVNHKQIGVAVVVLMMFRLLWRLISTSVEPISESTLLRTAAYLNHMLLYLVVIAQGLVGIAMLQAAGSEVTLYGLAVPIIAGEQGPFSTIEFLSNPQLLRTWHYYGGNILFALVGLHFLAALAHHFYWSDDTLRRMWFGYRAPHERDVPRFNP